jgi:hypothetical protein
MLRYFQTPPFTSLVVRTPDGQKELLLPDHMKTIRKDGKIHIVHGDMSVPIPAAYNAYETCGKIFCHDGRLCKLSRVEGIDLHPDTLEELAAVTCPVSIESSDFLGLELFEIRMP